MEQTKPNFFARIGNYFKEVKNELKKVVWPALREGQTEYIDCYYLCSDCRFGYLGAGFALWLGHVALYQSIINNRREGIRSPILWQTQNGMLRTLIPAMRIK